MKNENQKNGFTLIELIVVVAVFIFVVGAAIAIFISVVQNQRRVLEEQELLSQTSYVIEYMSKALRMAKRDETGDCLQENQTKYPNYSYLLTRYDSNIGAYKGIKFINQSDNDSCEEFFFDTSNFTLKEIKNNDSKTEADLTSEKFKLNYARFIINGNKNLQGAFEGDGIQPRVSILLDIRANTAGSDTDRIIQTTISQRNLNTNY